MNLPSVNKPVKNLPIAGLNPTYQVIIRKFNSFCELHPDSDDLVGLFLTEMARTRSISTVNTYKAALKKALKIMMSGSRMDTSANIVLLDNMFREIKTGIPEVKVRREKTLSRKELEELVRLSGYKTGLIIRALYQTAARVSELVNIRIVDCRETEKGIIIRVVGKGRKARSLYMTHDIYHAIRKTYNGREYLFETKKGRAVNRRTVHTIIKRAGRKIGRPDIHAHTLRHSFATNRLTDLGIDAVSEYLGHSSPEITAKYYLHKSATIDEILQDE